MNCDRIAPWYRWLEYGAFGGALMRRRTAFLRDVRDARRALVAGEGDGRFVVKLVEQNPEASIDYIDLSAGMLDLARSRVTGNVNFQQGDILSAPLPAGEYDLIVTNFFFDCLDADGVRQAVDRLARAARPQAQWLIAEFRDAPSGVRHWWSRAWLAVLYWFFGWSTDLKTRRLTDHRPMMLACGFRLVRERSAWWGLLASELWERN